MAKRIDLNRFKWVSVILLVFQLFFSIYGRDLFPFSRYDSFSKYRKLSNGYLIYKVQSYRDSLDYRSQGVLFEGSKMIKYLSENGMAWYQIANRFPYPVYAIDKFTLGNFKNGGLYKRQRVFEKKDVR